MFPTYPETTCDWIVRHRPVDDAVFIAAAGATDAEADRRTRRAVGTIRAPPSCRGRATENAEGARTGTPRWEADGAMPTRTDAGTVAVAEIWLARRPRGCLGVWSES